MKIADLREAAMEWTVMIEGPDEFGEIQRAQVQIEKGFERLASGEIGLSIDDGKTIMSALQEFVVKQELATYALARRVCVSCERLRPVKDYTRRKIRTVFGTVAVKNSRWMGCRHCFPHFSMAFSVLGEICPDRATPELMEVTARLGSMLPYRKAAELLAEFLPIEPTESHQTVRKRTLTLGARLEDQSLRRERESPPLACERTQLELGMPEYAAYPHPLLLRSGDLVPDPLARDLPLELGEGQQHIERQPSHAGRGVERLGHRDEGDAMGIERLNQLGEAGARAGGWATLGRTATFGRLAGLRLVTFGRSPPVPRPRKSMRDCGPAPMLRAPANLCATAGLLYRTPCRWTGS
jgi:hypothetical protein